MANDNKIAVVTGAVGYLGSHTVDALLTHGYKVRGIDLPEANSVSNLFESLAHDQFELDQRDLLAVDCSDPIFNEVDYIFHCAAITDPARSVHEPEVVINANLMTTLRCLEAARHNGSTKLVYPSSAAVYGAAAWPAAEDHPVNTGNPYGFSKWMGEQAVLHWHDNLGVDAIIFRIFNGYGPRDQSPGVVGRFLQCRQTGAPIRVLGDGSAQRDFIFVSDIVDAFILGAESEHSGKIYNLASGKTRTIKELAKLMDCPIEYAPRRTGEPDVICADISKIKEDLNWSPNVSLEAGIAAAIAYLDKSGQ